MKYADPSELEPYTDRRRKRDQTQRLPNDIMVGIGKMACDGASFDQIYHEFSRLEVTAEQIRRLLVPRDEEPKAKPRRQERANTGYAKMKARFRR